jgi:5-methyltetrahydrofolate--homocysteine methyltransferase
VSMETDILKELRGLVIQGRVHEARAIAEKAIDGGTDADTLIHQALVPAMSVVGERFERMEYYLPEMLAAATAMQSCMELLRPLLVDTGISAVATVVLGTVQGDLHDIGKDLVGMMLEGAGFEVVDLGVDVAPDRFVEAIGAHSAAVLGMSALLTTTMPMMRQTIERLEEAGVRNQIKVIVGGAAITQSFADEIGADSYAPDASVAVRRTQSLLGPVQAAG